MKIAKPTLIITGPMTVNVEIDSQLNTGGDMQRRTPLQQERAEWLAMLSEINDLKKENAVLSAKFHKERSMHIMTITQSLSTFVGFALPATLLGMRNMEQD